jgi:hypothetical protein
LTRLRTLLSGGLAATASLWTPVEAAYDWVFRAAAILANVAGLSGSAVKASYRGLLGAMTRHGEESGDLSGALRRFRKVTRSYWSGLFRCYEVEDLPRTNNDLEHVFGSNRYHERRCTGRRAASPAMVLRGPVRLVAATTTRLHTFTADAIVPADVDAWRALRGELDQRRDARTLRRRFRRDPDAYLRQLEQQLNSQTTLPP